MNPKERLEHIVETSLWTVRFLAIIPVFFGLVSVVALFLLGSLEIVYGLGEYLNLFYGKTTADESVAKIMGDIIGGIDLYLIGIFLMIFSFGIYELFISKIDIGRENDELQILEIKSLDQLKDKVLKVIVMVLVVSFFKRVIEMHITTSADILYLSISILLVSASSYLLRSNHDN